MLRITLSRLGSPEHVIDLRDRTLRIGRGAGNEVLLQDPDKTVSRTHGEVRREAVGWVFIDNDSQNGSWIEGRRVDRVVLRDGVAIAFGDYELICQESETPEQPADRSAAACVPVADALGPEDQTRLGGTAAAPAADPDDLHQVPTVMVPAFAPSDDTTPAQRPPVRRTDIYDMPTVFAPTAEAAPPADEDDDADAKTIVVPADAGAPIVTSVAEAAALPDDLAELPTIIVPGYGSSPQPVDVPDTDEDAATIVAPGFGSSPPPVDVPDADEDAATIVVPSFGGEYPDSAAPPPPMPVQPSWFDQAPTPPTPRHTTPPPAAGDRPTVMAAPPPVFPIVPGPDADATQVVPGDLSELFRSHPPSVDPGVPRPSTASSGVVPPPPSEGEDEEVATLLIPGRTPTGQLSVPPRLSGEVAVPPPVEPPSPSPSSGAWAAFPPPVEAAPAPWSLPPVEPIPVGSAVPTPAPFPAPSFEPPPVAPPLAPVTAVAPPPAPLPPAPAYVPPAAPPPVTAAPAPPAPPAPPAMPAVSKRPPASSPFRPAVLVWGLAWLALFALIAAAIWMWTSSDGSTSTQAPSESPAPVTPPATESSPPPAEPTTPAAGAATDTGATTPPADATAQPSAGPPVAPPPPAPPVAPTPGTRATAPAEVWVDGPPLTPQGTGVPRRPGERTADYRRRVADLERQYSAGRDALVAGRDVEARDLLRSVAAAAPEYKDVSGLLADAEAAVRREGAAALASGEKLEQAREFEKALGAFRRAGQLGIPADQVAAATQRVQQQMRAAGEKAFADARQFDGLGRNADAARLYEIAIRYLPEGDPRRAQARQRLDALAVRRP